MSYMLLLSPHCEDNTIIALIQSLNVLYYPTALCSKGAPKTQAIKSKSIIVSLVFDTNMLWFPTVISHVCQVTGL